MATEKQKVEFAGSNLALFLRSLGIFGKIGKDISEGWKEGKRFRETVNKPFPGFYIDNNCRIREVATDEVANIGWTKDEEERALLVGLRVAINFAEEARKKRRVETLANPNATAYQWDDDKNGSRKGFLFSINRYKDLKTGQFYICKLVKKRRFYSDYNTGLLIRPTDGELAYAKRCGELGVTGYDDDLTYDEIISSFNEENRNKFERYIEEGKQKMLFYGMENYGRDDLDAEDVERYVRQRIRENAI